MAIGPFPTRGLLTLRDAMERLFDESLVRPTTILDGMVGVAADMHETRDAYVITLALPGVKPEQIDIQATGNEVSVKGEFVRESQAKTEDYLRQERRYGKFHRMFDLGVEIDPDRVEATFADGILTLRLPKSESVKPKQVKVRTVTPK